MAAVSLRSLRPRYERFRLIAAIGVGLILLAGSIAFMAIYDDQTFAGDVGSNGFSYFIAGPMSQGAFALYFVDQGMDEVGDGFFPFAFIQAGMSAFNCVLSIVAIAFVIVYRKLRGKWQWLALALIYLETLFVNLVQDAILAFSSF